MNFYTACKRKKSHEGVQGGKRGREGVQGGRKEGRERAGRERAGREAMISLSYLYVKTIVQKQIS